LYKDIAGYVGRYQISDDGFVRSLISNKILRPGKDKDGYLQVCLWTLSENGSCPKYFKVHRLVMEAFVGIRPEKYHICHNDGDKANNSLFNLRFDTAKGNNDDKIIHGTGNSGERNGNSKLTTEDVLDIKSFIKNDLKDV
jgi:hypothetical protein